MKNIISLNIQYGLKVCQLGVFLNSLLFFTIIGIPLGILGLKRYNRLFDYISSLNTQENIIDDKLIVSEGLMYDSLKYLRMTYYWQITLIALGVVLCISLCVLGLVKIFLQPANIIY